MNSGWIVILCFNEEGNILRLVERVEEEIDSHNWDWQILCINDGSSDGTAEEIDRTRERFSNVHRVDHERNLGYAQGVKTAARFLTEKGADFAIFMDADLTHDPSYLKDFATAFSQGADLAVGSRYVQKGGAQGVPLWRKALSWAGNLVGRAFLIPVRDATSGYRGFSRRALPLLLLCQEKDFSIQLEEVLLIKRGKLNIREIPIVLGVREVGVSKFHYSLPLFWRYARLLWGNLFRFRSISNLTQEEKLDQFQDEHSSKRY